MPSPIHTCWLEVGRPAIDKSVDVDVAMKLEREAEAEEREAYAAGGGAGQVRYTRSTTPRYTALGEQRAATAAGATHSADVVPLETAHCVAPSAKQCKSRRITSFRFC
jgi:hypothetical protein